MYRRILVPLDGSTLSARVLPHAAALAETFGATLVLLRVIVPLADIIVAEATAVGLTPAPAVDPTPIYNAEREAAESYLAAAADMLERKGLEVDVDVEEGRAADVIVERARDLRVDLIAMTTHGRGGLGRLILGSTADEVLHHADRPVLLVRVREDD
jgi:nucleotide-binding universal stress UspA family protein